MIGGLGALNIACAADDAPAGVGDGRAAAGADVVMSGSDVAAEIAADEVASVDAIEAAAPEPPPPEIAGCAPDGYVDHTAADAPRQIAWGHGVGLLPERCMKIRAGQSVAFVGDHSAHPLAPIDGEGGNPFFGQANGMVHFDRAGLYPFVCGDHPGMRGAIWAVRRGPSQDSANP